MGGKKRWQRNNGLSLASFCYNSHTARGRKQYLMPPFSAPFDSPKECFFSVVFCVFSHLFLPLSAKKEIPRNMYEQTGKGDESPKFRFGQTSRAYFSPFFWHSKNHRGKEKKNVVLNNSVWTYGPSPWVFFFATKGKKTHVVPYIFRLPKDPSFLLSQSPR